MTKWKKKASCNSTLSNNGSSKTEYTDHVEEIKHGSKLIYGQYEGKGKRLRHFKHKFEYTIEPRPYYEITLHSQYEYTLYREENFFVLTLNIMLENVDESYNVINKTNDSYRIIHNDISFWSEKELTELMKTELMNRMCQ